MEKRLKNQLGLPVAAMALVLAAPASAQAVQPWLAPEIVAEMAAAKDEAAREAIANQRARLLISAMTVNTHLRNIYRKLQVRTRAQAVRFASLRGLF